MALWVWPWRPSWQTPILFWSQPFLSHLFTPIYIRSYSSLSIHLSLGLPFLPLPPGLAFGNFFTVFTPSLLTTCLKPFQSTHFNYGYSSWSLKIFLHFFMHFSFSNKNFYKLVHIFPTSLRPFSFYWNPWKHFQNVICSYFSTYCFPKLIAVTYWGPSCCKTVIRINPDFTRASERFLCYSLRGPVTFGWAVNVNSDAVLVRP